MQHFNPKFFKLILEQFYFLKCCKQNSSEIAFCKISFFPQSNEFVGKKCAFCNSNQSFRYLNVINSSCEQSSCQRQDINKVPRAEPSVNITSLLRITNHSERAIIPKPYFIITATFCLLKHIIIH